MRKVYFSLYCFVALLIIMNFTVVNSGEFLLQNEKAKKVVATVQLNSILLKCESERDCGDGSSVSCEASGGSGSCRTTFNGVECCEGTECTTSDCI